MMATSAADTNAKKRPGRYKKKLTESAVSKLASVWLYPGKHGLKTKADVNLLEHAVKIGEWIDQCCALPNCISVHNKKDLTCKCMHGPTNEEERRDCIDCLVTCAKMPPQSKDVLLAEWMKYALLHDGASVELDDKRMHQYKTTNCILPGTTRQICKHAMAHVSGMGRGSWTARENAALKCEPVQHGLIGKESNKHNKEGDEALHELFTELSLKALPRATRLVSQLAKQKGKEVLKCSLRDEKEETLDLPSHMTKHGIWKRFIKNQGWLHDFDDTDKTIGKTKLRESAMEHPPSWKCFLTFWKKHHKDVRIPKASEDICGECYVCANRIRYKQSKTGKKGLEALEEDDSDEEDDGVTVPSENVVGENSKVKVNDDILTSENLVKQAAEHVKNATNQRKLFNKHKEEAKRTKNLPPHMKTKCFVIDCAQNMHLPNFASEQPGETHYFSPLNAHALGIVDCAEDTMELAAHTHFEYDGKKGGNNVASLVWKELHRQGLGPGSMVKEIVFVFDNCAGQNKNKMVIRLLTTILVNLKFCKKAVVMFLIRGHTKNDCDRLFNRMKSAHRASNCYTPDQLFKHIRTNNSICVKVDSTKDFVNFDKYEDKCLQKLPKTLDKHIFTATTDDPNKIEIQMADYHKPKSHFTVKKKYRDVDWSKDIYKELEVIPPKGLQDIKHVELCDKWRPLVPKEHRAAFKCYSEDPGLERRGLAKKQKEMSQKARKERTITNKSKAQAAAQESTTTAAAQESTTTAAAASLPKNDSNVAS